MPGMPWVAAASVVLNVFLLGSVSAQSWRLFAVWAAATLAFYLLYSLPASYAHSSERCAHWLAAPLEKHMPIVWYSWQVGCRLRGVPLHLWQEWLLRAHGCAEAMRKRGRLRVDSELIARCSPDATVQAAGKWA